MRESNIPITDRMLENGMSHELIESLLAKANSPYVLAMLNSAQMVFLDNPVSRETARMLWFSTKMRRRTFMAVSINITYCFLQTKAWY